MNTSKPNTTGISSTAADLIDELGPFEGIDTIHGVTWDGRRIWIASGDRLNAVDPASGRIERSIAVAADAGTAFDGRHLYQIAEAKIHKIDPASGEVVSTIPAPGDGCDSGLAWAEGSLWVGQYNERRIHRIDPDSGRILGTVESNRFVTGVTWVDGELWHGTWEAEQSELRCVDPDSGQVRQALAMPAGTGVSGLESDKGDRFFCGGGDSGKLRIVRRPGTRA